MKLKSSIMDESQMLRSLARIAHEIIEKNNGVENIYLLGIKRRGTPLAKILAENIEKFEGVKIPYGEVDITLYRDDLSEISEQAQAKKCQIPETLNNRIVILVDDVLFTGRTARAGIEAIIQHGRPQSIQLAVLVDRGHRELPIRPDYIGKNIPTSKDELVQVHVLEFDGDYGVFLYQK